MWGPRGTHVTFSGSSTKLSGGESLSLHFERVILRLQGFFFFFPLLQNTLRIHSCLPQHIKQSSCGACQTPVTNCDYEWHCGDPGVAVARSRKHTREAYSFSFAGSHTHTHAHTQPSTRLLTRLNFRADVRRALWRVIWLLWRAASSVCSRKLQLRHAHTWNTFPSFHIPVWFIYFFSIPAREVTRTVCLISAWWLHR